MRFVAYLLLSVVACLAGPVTAQPAVAYADLAPILAQHCAMCHSGATAAAGLSVEGVDALLKGSAKGPVVKPGDPGNSELIRRLKGTSQPRMPMTGPPFLADAQVAMFERWIAAGAPRGDAAVAQAPAVAVVGGEAPASVSASAAPSPRQATAPQRPQAGEPVTYLHVAPIFARRCATCHTDNGRMGAAPEGYRLTSHAATLSPNDRARVVPGQPAASELVRRIRGQARPRMPFDGPPYLGDEEVKLIETWVAQGARDAAGTPAPMPVGAALRLHGTLGPGPRLDDLNLRLGAGTRIDKRPTEGDYVEVRGRLDAAGNVMVERLRRR